MLWYFCERMVDLPSAKVYIENFLIVFSANT